jgi:hypothetical protein
MMNEVQIVENFDFPNIILISYLNQIIHEKGHIEEIFENRLILKSSNY